MRAKLLNVSMQTRLPYQMLLTRFIQERLLYRLSQSDYNENFFLKGGALLYAYDRFQARPTLDIDFLGEHISRDMQLIINIFRQIVNNKCEEDGVIFDNDSVTAEIITVNKEYNGIRVHVMAALDSAKQMISMDIGFGDIITPCAQKIEFPLLISDLPPANIMAYSLETVVAEKFQAMIALAEGNSRMKDFFDVYRILTNYSLDKNILSQAITSTFDNRGTVRDPNHPLFDEAFAKDVIRNTSWKRFLNKIHWDEDLPFQLVWKTICDELSPYF